MKSYKLIKEYPGSPKLDTIFEYWTDGISEQIYNKSNNPSFFPLKIVTDYSEFWEEVVEKDYEILSIYSTINGIILSDSNVNIWESKINTRVNWEIHQVKRLSDGEVFTIGDKVRIKKLRCDGSFIIDRFYFDCNNDKLLCNGKCTGNGHVSISKIEKVKTPLFCTEDGVDIYEGDEYFTVRDRDFSISCDGNGFKSKGKHFSTKEAAEEYILMNKPCLSLKDINNYYLKTTVSEHILNSFKQLVKSRL